MLGVVWAGCGLGMILHRDDWQRRVTQAFDAIVVEVDVGDFYFLWQRLRFHCEAMIMRSDFHVSIARIPDRLIAAAMTKHQFKSLATKGSA